MVPEQAWRSLFRSRCWCFRGPECDIVILGKLVQYPAFPTAERNNRMESSAHVPLSNKVTALLLPDLSKQGFATLFAVYIE